MLSLLGKKNMMPNAGLFQSEHNEIVHTICHPLLTILRCVLLCSQ